MCPIDVALVRIAEDRNREQARTSASSGSNMRRHPRPWSSTPWNTLSRIICESLGREMCDLYEYVPHQTKKRKRKGRVNVNEVGDKTLTLLLQPAVAVRPFSLHGRSQRPNMVRRFVRCFVLGVYRTMRIGGIGSLGPMIVL